MADQVVTEMDSQVAATTPPRGTDAPANDLSKGTDTGTGQQPTPQGFDEDFLKKLDLLDPASLPQSFAEKYVPKAEFTKKTQALAEEKKKFETEKATMFELARRAIQDRPASPAGPTAEDVKRQELQQLAVNGDPVALQQLIDMAAEAKVNPIRTETALRNAYEEATRSNAFVAPHWNEILQVMQTNPDIAAMATSNGMRGAAKVMIALGQERELMDLRPKYEASGKEIEALKLRLAGYERERAAGLPSSTTRAGTTTGSPAAGDAANIEEAGLKAWLAVGGRAEDYR